MGVAARPPYTHIYTLCMYIYTYILTYPITHNHRLRQLNFRVFGKRKNLCCGILKPNLIYISMRESEFLAFQLDDQTPFCLSPK